MKIAKQACPLRSMTLFHHNKKLLRKLISLLWPSHTTLPSLQPEKQESQQPTKKWDEYHSRWEDIWTGEGSGAKLQPGQLFDQGRSPPILPTLLTKGTVNVQGKRCLVPGCGRGYDVATFAKFGAAESVGLELAPSALEAAAAYLASEASLTPEEKARTRLVAGDFFAFSETFDVAFDYTFLCALHPDMRPAWATTYARMIKPGGILVTLVYPMDREKPRDSGPPFPLFPEDYEILKPAGFELVSMERVPDVLSHPPRVGKENIGIWRRK